MVFISKSPFGSLTGIDFRLAGPLFTTGCKFSIARKCKSMSVVILKMVVLAIILHYFMMENVCKLNVSSVIEWIFWIQRAIWS